MTWLQRQLESVHHQLMSMLCNGPRRAGILHRAAKLFCGLRHACATQASAVRARSSKTLLQLGAARIHRCAQRWTFRADWRARGRRGARQPLPRRRRQPAPLRAHAHVLRRPLRAHGRARGEHRGVLLHRPALRHGGGLALRRSARRRRLVPRGRQVVRLRRALRGLLLRLLELRRGRPDPELPVMPIVGDQSGHLLRLKRRASRRVQRVLHDWRRGCAVWPTDHWLRVYLLSGEKLRAHRTARQRGLVDGARRARPRLRPQGRA